MRNPAAVGGKRGDTRGAVSSSKFCGDESFQCYFANSIQYAYPQSSQKEVRAAGAAAKRTWPMR